MEEQRVSLSAGEWRVMEVLWAGPKTLMELVRALGEDPGWAKSTVTTMARRMERKGLITYTTEGRAKVFQAALAREDAAAAETVSALCAQEKYTKRLLLMPGDIPRFSFRLAKNEDPLRAARQVVEDYARVLEA